MPENAAWNVDLFKRALDFSARAHEGQKVPGSGYPYVVHSVKVTMEVLHACAMDRGVDADLALCAAMLHDTIEDTSVTFATIEQEFGLPVANGVMALTKNSALPKANRMADSLRRVREQPREIWMVKLADRITNLEPPPPDWSREKCGQYLAEARLILTTLRGASYALEVRLTEKMAGYEAYV